VLRTVSMYFWPSWAKSAHNASWSSDILQLILNLHRFFRLPSFLQRFCRYIFGMWSGGYRLYRVYNRVCDRSLNLCRVGLLERLACFVFLLLFFLFSLMFNSRCYIFVEQLSLYRAHARIIDEKLQRLYKRFKMSVQYLPWFYRSLERGYSMQIDSLVFSISLAIFHARGYLSCSSLSKYQRLSH